MTPAERPTVLYRITGTRPTRHGRETVTVLRRTWPAAKHAADKLDATGRGPARVDFGIVPRWSEVLR